MDRININNLFSSSTINNKPLDVHSLYNPKENKIKNNIKFNVDRLVNVRDEQERRIYDGYKKIYNMCLNKIDTANSMRKTEIIYEIPRSVFRCPDYSPWECKDYLQKKLRKLDMDTLMMSDHFMFISWLNIKENRKKELNEQEERKREEVRYMELDKRY